MVDYHDEAQVTTPWCYLPNIPLFPNSVYLRFLPCVSNLSTQEHAFVSPTKHPGVTNLVDAEHCGKIKKGGGWCLFAESSC